MSHSGRFITSLDGTHIWADNAGSESGTPVVFIHAFACTSLIWEKQFSDLTLLKNLYMVRYELRGHGRSDCPLEAEAYTSLKNAEDFKAVCQAFGLRNPFVCAWSYGAFIPVDVVENFGPDSIAGVVYAGGPGISRNIHQELVHPHILDIRSLLSTTDANEVPRAADAFVDSCFKDARKDLPYEARLQWLAGFVMQPPVVRTHTANRLQSSKRWMEEFTGKPHLLVHGADDMHIQTEKVIAVVRRVFSNVEIRVLAGVGHALAWEAANELNKYLLEFVLAHYVPQSHL